MIDDKLQCLGLLFEGLSIEIERYWDMFLQEEDRYRYMCGTITGKKAKKIDTGESCVVYGIYYLKGGQFLIIYITRKLFH